MTNTKIESALGFREVLVHLADAKPETWKIQQILIDRYQDGMKVLEDEVAMVAFTCGKTIKEVQALHPQSYEVLRAAVWEVNEHGFFRTAARWADEAEKKLRARLAAFDPDTIKTVIAEGARLLSQRPSPGSPPPRA